MMGEFMRRVGALTLCLAGLSGFGTATAQEVTNPAYPDILDMRTRAEVQDDWLTKRLDRVVPMIMEREGVDMWVLIAREYNEDPVVKTMLPTTWLNARRRTVLVFSRADDGTVERFAVARYAVGDVFPAAWSPEQTPDQWARLAELIEERDPETIALNVSEVFAISDGLTYSEYEALKKSLPRKYAKRLVFNEGLAIGWLETRIPEEIDRYPEIVRIAHAMIAEAFSSAVIKAGVTSTSDVEWWLRDKVAEHGLSVWFHPSVSVQRPDTPDDPLWADSHAKADIIRPGDFLHVDFGITYLGLNTDTQHHGYVLRSGETDAPQGLKDGLKSANKVQDALTDAYQVGRTSNEVLKIARAAAIEQGLDPTIYTHPLGDHGHAAGSPIGWWDDQSPDHEQGFRPVQASTAWSIELNAKAAVPEWDGKIVLFKTEEDAFFDGKTVEYLDGRQTELHLIGPAE